MILSTWKLLRLYYKHFHHTYKKELTIWDDTYIYILTILILVIISQYICISNYHSVYSVSPRYSNRGFWNFWRITFTKMQVRIFWWLLIFFPSGMHTPHAHHRAGFVTQCIHRRKSTGWEQGESHSQLLGGAQGVPLLQQSLFLTPNPSTQFESKKWVFLPGFGINVLLCRSTKVG